MRRSDGRAGRCYASSIFSSKEAVVKSNHTDAELAAFMRRIKPTKVRLEPEVKKANEHAARIERELIRGASNQERQPE